MATPADHGFRMPAEWAPHARTWMAWPCRAEIWGDRIEAARASYADVANAISSVEPVTMVCNPDDVIEASLALGSSVEVMPLEIDDSWLRDSGPIFLLDGQGGMAAAHFRFNAWGGKYTPYDKDAAVAAGIVDRVGVQRFEAPFVLEGGAVTVDGLGTAIVTEECLLNPNRNPGMTKEKVEENLAQWLGITRTIWLPQGYEEDETDGHVDEIAAFAKPGVVLALTTDDKDDANYDVLQDNLDILRSATDATGAALQVVELPQPAARDYPTGGRITLSYANFYLCNGAVIIPGFGQSADDRAYKVFREVYPDRQIIQVPAYDIAWGGGCIHCITQQQPAIG
ncbi:agmatine deiminase family protein [Fodinicurvata sp. EGI_FJ10296]|uniref:agmatine deiminase family protein n=1 Tax=Fodinicurvata sp. EGI_FJ10296 TaxID=3231908 RepID=UPI003456BA6D